MKKFLSNLLLIAFIGLLGLSVWKIIDLRMTYHAGEESYDSLEQYVSFTEPPNLTPATEPPLMPTIPGETTPPTEAIPEPTEEPDDTVWPWVDFAELEKINPDVVGWIFIEGTTVNYPIVQCEDNTFYLKHIFDRSYHKAGCIFLDKDSSPDFTDQHSIIHGHNRNDNAMFSSLANYKDQSFYDEHQVVLVVTPTHRYKIRLFSGYVAETEDNAWKKGFLYDSFGSWLTEITERSCFTSDCIPTEENQIVTLSTCSYEFYQARFVVHGIIERSFKIPTDTDLIGEASE